MTTGVRTFEFRFFNTDEELAEAAARGFASRVLAARKQSRFFGVALSGGRIAGKFFSKTVEALAGCGGVGTQTHFFWADERCVPPTHAESNFRTANELLLRPLGVGDSQIHRIPGELDPGEAALRAAEEYDYLFGARAAAPSNLDLALLGMGEDGHIASLFPGESAETMTDSAIFRAVVGPKPPPNRVTMGYQTLVAASEVWVLVSGSGKEAALKESLKPGGATPLARLLRMRTNAHVYSSVPLSKGSG